jgi:beta-lactamase class D
MIMTLPSDGLTRRTLLQLASGAVALAALPGLAHSMDVSERDDLAAIFKTEGLDGCFAHYSPSTDNLTLVNGPRARTAFVPASTFKIPNSLIALETGVVKDENEIIPYGGKPQPIKAWEQDMGLADALRISNVPVYQEIARRVGVENYEHWLKKLDYGNQQCGDVVDRFWLDGPLKISAIEQAEFVARFAQGKLSVSERSHAIVRRILEVERKDGRVLFAKTGWAMKKGWWAGWVEHEGSVDAFALNIELMNIEDAPKRISTGKELLGKLGVY